MAIRVGINGFGRIGRLAFRAAWGRPELEIVHINEIAGDADACAHLLSFDSVFGRWPTAVEPVDGQQFQVEGRPITCSRITDPAGIPWREFGVDLVLECTGRFRTPESLQPHFDRGARKVVVSAPVKGEGIQNFVYGVNDHLYDGASQHLITAASCTTNCLAPVVKVIHESLGIRHGLITTIHDQTNTQSTVDTFHKDLRRARASSVSLIPTTTGSATAIALIFPELTGKLNGHAVRVPLMNASLTDCVFEVARPTTVEEVNGLLHAAAEGPLQGILGFEERPLVSVDYKGDARSSIVDAALTLVNDGTQVKILAWYDNEWGYSNRLVDLAAKVARDLENRA